MRLVGEGWGSDQCLGDSRQEEEEGGGKKAGWTEAIPKTRWPVFKIKRVCRLSCWKQESNICCPERRPNSFNSGIYPRVDRNMSWKNKKEKKGKENAFQMPAADLIIRRTGAVRSQHFGLISMTKAEHAQVPSLVHM